METSPLLKIFIVFAGLLVLGRLRVPLYISLLLGGLAFNYWGGNAPRDVLISLGKAVIKPDTWLLMLITALVVEFGRELADKKNTEAILSFARRLGGKSGRLWSLMIIPALIGLMPMPAGALFSAPLVQQSVSATHWKPEWKAAVNYWFRHVWEYWWPIYPVVIIGMAVFKMETWRFVATTIVFTPTAFIFGYWFLLRPHRTGLASEQSALAGGLSKFINLIWPLFVIIVFVLIMPLFTARIFPMLEAQTSKLIAMLAGVLIGLGIIWLRTRHTSRLFESFFTKHNINILLTVGSIMIFQYLLETSRLLPAASAELIRSGMSVLPIIALLPFLAGLITGVAAGFAGIAFPLVVGLVASGAGGLTPMAALALSFGFGYMGMMLSPIHLCLLMTRDFFSASLLPIYRHLAACVLAQTAFTIILFAILTTLKV